MSVAIKLEDGRTVLVRDSLDAVQSAFRAAVAAGETIQIDTPDGPIYINPTQVVSFEPLSPAQKAAAAAAAVGPEAELV